MRFKKDIQITDKSIVKLVFCAFDEKTNSPKPYGSMIWENNSWVIDVDTPTKSIETFQSNIPLADRTLTLKDYDLCHALIQSQSSTCIIRGYTKEFCDKNADRIKENPLLDEIR